MKGILGNILFVRLGGGVKPDCNIYVNEIGDARKNRAYLERPPTACTSEKGHSVSCVLCGGRLESTKYRKAVS